MEFGDVRGKLLLSDIYLNMTPEGREKIISYDVSQAENEDIKSFIADYKEWYENKENVNYYIDKARESLNVNQDVWTAQYYIREGLALDPANATLQLYKIYIYVNYVGSEYTDDEDGDTLLKYQLDVLNEILEKGLSSRDLKAFAYYLKAAVLYRLDEKDASKAEMKTAIEFNSFYATVYEQFFGKEN